MNRQMLSTVLKKLEPALSTQDTIPIFVCLCFEKERVHAYDDTIALVWPLDKETRPGFTGGVRGKLFLDWLSTSRAEEVKLTLNGDTLNCKAGRAKLDIPVSDEKSFLFEEPDLKKAREMIISESMFESLAAASVSMSADPSKPWGMGITVIDGEDSTVLYSNNDRTITRVKIGKGEEKGSAMIFPPRFVELLLSINPKDNVMSVHMTKSFALAKFQSGLRMFTRSIEECEPSKYQEIFNNTDSSKEKALIPKGFEAAIDRAITVIKFTQRPSTVITVGDGKMRLVTDSTAGIVTDVLPFEGHPDIEVRIPPELIKAGLKGAKFVSVLRQCVRLSGGGRTFLASTTESQD